MKSRNWIWPESTQEARPRKRPIPIRVMVFFLAAVIMLFMPPAAIAQYQASPQSPLSMQEERIMRNCTTVMQRYDPALDAVLQKDLETYLRDGCKKAMAGDWRWDSWGDIVTIIYDEQSRIFLGKVKRPAEMALNPGHLLFKVDYSRNALFNIGVSCNNVEGLRTARSCSFGQFTGTEYSFEQRTKKPTATNLILILRGDRIEYKVEKDAYSLTRIK